MESFVERMIVEKDELQDKVTKLENFVNGEKFRELRGLEQVYLKEQLKFMRGYLSVLRQRINFYNKFVWPDCLLISFQFGNVDHL